MCRLENIVCAGGQGCSDLTSHMQKGEDACDGYGKRQTADLAQSIIDVLQLLLRIKIFLHECLAVAAGAADTGSQLTTKAASSCAWLTY